MSTKAWSEKVSIATYEIALPEKNPMFLERRVYQGSSGKVYPLPIVESISDEKVDKEWQGCFLENDFLKILILPELGGRVQMAYDKTKERHFVYYNEVIKPALVGITGPWISGGIEFNWPQHHRPSTYDPIDFFIEENEDGSKTVWCSEIDRMYGTKGMAGFTIYPDKAYLEIKVKLYNRTSRPQTFLWWANPAVAVNDEYQSVFPPDVNAVFDHGKRDVSSFPIATGTYYKFDYSPGTDISRYRNIPVPTSYMAIKSKYNFVGGYENDTMGGLLHVANHHVSPGKKQWTWGNGDFGKAWDRNLTDTNGPYIELMCGVYTDNQPDFSWLMPYEEKAFNQYFMPYQDLGVVKNASKEAMLNLEFEGAKAHVKVYATGIYPNTTIQLKANGQIFLDEKFDLRPGVSFIMEVKVDPSIVQHQYYICVLSEEGNLLIDWTPEKQELKSIPEPAEPAKLPKDILTVEELYLTGLHIEQYRHATFNPVDYYQEALCRDSCDIRCNNAMGMVLLRAGKFVDAEKYFLTAYKRQTSRNPNPYDGESLFNLGLSFRFQNKDREAYEAFYKSVWNASFMDSGYFHIAQIDALNQNWDVALDTVNRSLVRNWHNHKARHLKVAILRKKGNHQAAIGLATESLQLDGFNFGLLYEKYLLGESEAEAKLIAIMRANIHNYIEISLDYCWAGLYEDAIEFLNLGMEQQASIYPMALYFKAWFLEKLGRRDEAILAIREAEKCASDYCFPNRLEAVLALENAIKLCPKVGMASYYLGNFWYNARQYGDAIKCWEASVSKNETFPTAHRNLALAYFNKSGNPSKALSALERAFKLDESDARVFMELDHLYKRLNKSVEFRLAIFDKYPDLISRRDDLYLERIYLLILQENFSEAYDFMMKRKFHPWEGGEGKVTKAYKFSLVGMAMLAIGGNEFSKAIDYLEKSKVYPHNLGEGKLQGAVENDIDYLLGCAYEGMGNYQRAEGFWEKATHGDSDPREVWFYNDQPPDAIFYQGLALLKLDKKDEALIRFEKLIAYGKQHVSDKVMLDYFAVSLPDFMIWEEKLDEKNKIHCSYIMALGYKGMGNNFKSSKYFKEVLGFNCAHLGAKINQQVTTPISEKIKAINKPLGNGKD